MARVYPRFYDVVDLVRYKVLDDLDAELLHAIRFFDYHFTDDPLDWIREDLDQLMATPCPACGEGWLYGPESLAAGKCWRCRS